MHSSLIYYCHSPAIREWQRTSLRAHSARTHTHAQTHTRRERKAYTHTQSAFIWRDGNTSGQPFIEIYRETTNECEEKTVTHRVYKQIDKTNNKWCPWECHLLWAQLTSLPVTRIGCDQIGFVYLVENRHNVSPPHTHTHTPRQIYSTSIRDDWFSLHPGYLSLSLSRSVYRSFILSLSSSLSLVVAI